MAKRKYTKTRRAAQQDETRDRIVEATVKLHETLGPADTTIKAVAEEAGVQRLTVYRHFPDEISLFQACSTRFLEQNPPPGMADWSSKSDAAERCYTALLAFYRYYRQTEKMWSVVYRDLGKVAALQGPMDQFEGYLDTVGDDLFEAWGRQNPVGNGLQATLRHALRFSTWQSLQSAHLEDEDIAALVQSWLRGLL